MSDTLNKNNEEKLTSMKTYFDEEAIKHDDFFVNDLGLTEFYDEIEKVLNNYSDKTEILVLGCGSGLEIERIKFPSNVKGIDLSDKMLEVLKNKKLNENVKLTTVCGSFLDLDFESNRYDIVLSCYAMHHFNESQKLQLYKKIFNCLKKDGIFINGDSFSKTREEENNKMLSANKIYEEQNLPFASLHIDVHFCFEHEKEVLFNVGFRKVDLIKEWTMSKIYISSK